MHIYWILAIMPGAQLSWSAPYTVQASGNGEYEHIQSMLRELRDQQLGEEESRQALDSSSAGADDAQDDTIKHADEMTKTQAK